jgi:hypothetical protein
MRLMKAKVRGLDENSLPNIFNGIEALGQYTVHVGIEFL